MTLIGLARTLHPKAPLILTRSYWSAKRLAILIGFILTVLSSLGPQFYVGPVEDQSADADQRSKVVASRIDTLRNAQSQYLLFEQMGVLIYALNATGLGAPGTPQRDTLNNLYQLSLLDRSTGVRQMIGELARAKQLTYRETADIYNALIAAARKDFSLTTYQAVDDFENGMMAQANALMAGLQQALLDTDQAKSDLDNIAGKRKTQLLVMLTLGSTLLLAANLLSQKEDKPPAPTGAAETTDQFTDFAAAARLIEMAMEKAKALGEADLALQKPEGGDPLRPASGPTPAP
jgi:hypothetical protein